MRKHKVNFQSGRKPNINSSCIYPCFVFRRWKASIPPKSCYRWWQPKANLRIAKKLTVWISVCYCIMETHKIQNAVCHVMRILRKNSFTCLQFNWNFSQAPLHVNSTQCLSAPSAGGTSSCLPVWHPCCSAALSFPGLQRVLCVSPLYRPWDPQFLLQTPRRGPSYTCFTKSSAFYAPL